MFVRLQGFIWTPTPGISLDDIMANFRNEGQVAIEHEHRDRVLAVEDFGTYYGGVFVTYKTNRKFPEMEDENGKLKIIISQAQGKNRLLDFNFFVVHKKMGRGLYLHYHQSAGFKTFGSFIGKRHKELANVARAKAIQENQLSGKEIKELYNCPFAYERLIKQDDFPELIKEIQKFKEFRFEFRTLVANEDSFEPLDDYVDKEHHRVTFRPKIERKGLIAGLVNVVKRNNITSGRVTGLDEHGRIQNITIADNISIFGEFEFDDIAETAAGYLDNIRESELLRLILNAANEHADVLLRKTK